MLGLWQKWSKELKKKIIKGVSVQKIMFGIEDINNLREELIKVIDCDIQKFREELIKSMDEKFDVILSRAYNKKSVDSSGTKKATGIFITKFIFFKKKHRKKEDEER